MNDCLVKVMDKDLSNVSHEEAVDILKKSPQRVRDVVVIIQLCMFSFRFHSLCFIWKNLIILVD